MAKGGGGSKFSKKMMTKGGQKSQKIDDVFYEWPLTHFFYVHNNEVEMRTIRW